MLRSSLGSLLSLFTLLSIAQCPPGQGELVVSIVPDNWPNEITWDVRSGGQILANGNWQGGEFCVPLNTCLIFTIYDSYGDGIFQPGGYWVMLDGDTVASGWNYNYMAITEINCPPGFSCGNPITVPIGEHVAPEPNTWYLFTPTLSGSYQVTTCDLAACDTRIWIYDHCQNLVWDDSPAGSMYFSEDGCGAQAFLNANLQAGVPVYIRIGGEGSCNGSSIPWAVNYLGPISGCTNVNSCNFDPLATIDDGSCIPFGDPDCPEAPDLVVDQGVLSTSLSLDTIEVSQSDCYIAEGCLNGFGPRELIKFTTRIANIGEQDYYIGNPAFNPDQFETQNCHGHVHYKGYAEYLLFDAQGQELAIGFKNGFCVMDIDCNGGGTFQYGCGDMGISAGCADIYGTGTACNWLDITTVPEGLYTLVVRTNWDNDPDALGRVETDLMNNWAQVCLFIDRSPGLSISIDDDCEPYFDCMGDIYGDAQLDCEGNCAGSALIGDLNTDQYQNATDVIEYVNGILGEDLTPAPCNDIDQDGNLTVTDAALMAYCNYWNTYNHPPDSNAVHDHCNFPFVEIINPYDSVTFTIGALDLDQGFLDIHVKNPNKKLLGYELEMSGIQITGVQSLYDPEAYPVTPEHAFGTGHLICLSSNDSLIQRGPLYKPLCRVYFINSESTICIAEVIDVVNENYHNSNTFLENECATITGLAETAVDQGIRVFPNPFTEMTTILYPPVEGHTVTLTLLDMQGRSIKRIVDRNGSGKLLIDGRDLAAGSYIYQLSGAVNAMGKLILEP